MSEETIEELVESYTRQELDEMAEALGLNSADYPNKRSISEAIVKAREEQRERERMEREREQCMEELKEKMAEDTVKGKIAATKLAAQKMREDAGRMLQEGVAAFQTAIQEQVKKKEQGVRRFRSLVEEQARENREAATVVQTGVQAIQAGIEEQANENQAYIKSFYG